MRFALYGHQALASMSLDELLALSRGGNIWAHAEDSGSEGCYVEVARWNDESNRWERFAFEKFLGGEAQQDVRFKDVPIDAYYEAEAVASLINENRGLKSIVHAMPDWGADESLRNAAPDLLAAVVLGIAAIEAAMLEDDPVAATQMEWEGEPLATMRAAVAKAKGESCTPTSTP